LTRRAEGTIWDGGIYNLELVFTDGDTPPRVKFLTEMWHPHSKSSIAYHSPDHNVVTTDGIPFYQPFLSPGAKDPVFPVLMAIKVRNKQLIL
jgi:hypothetical protein